jgi:type I restriction enzyme S subunit
MAFNQDVKAVVPRVGVSGEFLAHWFAASKDQMLGLVTEATHGTKRIDMRDLLRSHIGLPQTHEQQQLTGILNEIDAKLGCAAEEARKLQEIKRGLMQDLLTGRVPALVDMAATAEEVAANV